MKVKVFALRPAPFATLVRTIGTEVAHDAVAAALAGLFAPLFGVTVHTVAAEVPAKSTRTVSVGFAEATMT